MVDDHKLFRSGLKYILEESDQYQVIAEASNGAEFIELLNFYHPDLIILDINMPVMNGIEAAKIALTSNPSISILVLSLYGETEYYTTLLDIGVKGFVLKDADNEELLTAVQKIILGGTYFSRNCCLRSFAENLMINPSNCHCVKKKFLN